VSSTESEPFRGGAGKLPSSDSTRLAVAQTIVPPKQGLYDPAHEHDACGVGFIAHIKGQKSHTIVEQGLQILRNLTHRGATGADPLAGDGAGILLQIPDAFFRDELAKQGISLPAGGDYGVGMVFLPQEPASRLACEQEIERAVRAEGQVLIGWRDVPRDNSGLGDSVKSIEPVIRQVFIGMGSNVTVTDALERKLYVIRKRSGHAIQALELAHGKEFYVPSMSARTVVYKGMLLADQVGSYYLDLQDPRLVSALALVHQRFSTNTFPTWDLAHPFRLIAHNGEINTLRGNVNWIRARQGAISSPVLGQDVQKLWPLIYPGQSDSASFDNALELLVMAGYSMAHAMMMLIPEAWEKHTLMDENRRAFYEYHAAMMEPWDGPAAVAFTDGRQIGATLDRNGLRPARYLVTDDDFVMMASETGVLPIPEEKIVKKWRLQPGKMFLVDLAAGRIIDDKELKDQLAAARPYRGWIDSIRVKLDDIDASDAVTEASPVPLLDRQQAFGYTQEDLKFQLIPMGLNGEEGIGSMGNDSPMAVLSDKNKTLYHYFKQLFAQVTNPPIDPIREELVMSLVSFIGPKPNLLGIDETNPPMRLEVTQPILDIREMEKIRNIARYTDDKFRAYELDICYPAAWGKEAIEARLASLCAEAVDAVRSGFNILIVSDRRTSADAVAIPALLATSAIHLHLTEKGLRTSAGLVVETGSAREVHHFALLGGYGAEAVHPYLAMETLPFRERASGRQARREGRQELRQGGRQGPAQGHVQDGHLDLHVVHRRADLRSGRPVVRTGREVLHGHDIDDRGHRPVRGRRGGAAPASLRLRRRPGARAGARGGWRIRLPRPRRRAHVDARRDRQAPALHPRELVQHVQGIRADHQRSVASSHDVPRPVRPEDRPCEVGAAGRGRAREGHREALRDRRDVARLDLDRGAHDARDRDEPHRRQVEHG
jgi:glutamate synthase (NADPH/NADH) large chain